MKITVNGKDITFLIDYIRIPRKFHKEYQRNYYNLDVTLVADKELTNYEQEKVAEHIQRAINHESE